MQPTIYALHAVGVTPAMWDEVHALLPAIDLVAPDLVALAERGNGTLARLVDDVVEGAPPGPLVLAGCSFGGQLALEVAARLGDRVRSTLLVAPGPPELDAAFLERARGLERMLEHVWNEGMMETMMPLLVYPFGPNYPQAADLVRRMFRVNAVRSVPLVAMAPAFRSAGELLGEIPGKVRVLLGTANGNPVAGTGLAESWQDAVGQEAVQLVSGAAEFIPLDRPEVVAAALEEAVSAGPSRPPER